MPRGSHFDRGRRGGGTMVNVQGRAGERLELASDSKSKGDVENAIHDK